MDVEMAHVLPWPLMRDARGNVVFAWERPIIVREAGDSDYHSVDDSNDDESAPSIYEWSGPDEEPTEADRMNPDNWCPFDPSEEYNNEGSVLAPPDSEEVHDASSHEALTDWVMVNWSDVYGDDGYEADTEEIHDEDKKENIVCIEASGYHAERSCFLE
jgi:hypothetical protein